MPRVVVTLLSTRLGPPRPVAKALQSRRARHGRARAALDSAVRFGLAAPRACPAASLLDHRDASVRAFAVLERAVGRAGAGPGRARSPCLRSDRLGTFMIWVWYFLAPLGAAAHPPKSPPRNAWRAGIEHELSIRFARTVSRAGRIGRHSATARASANQAAQH